MLWVWPPLNGNALEIFTWGSLTPPSSLTSPYNAPPGYGDVIVYELAKRLYGICDKNMYAERRSFMWIAGQAEIAKRAIRNVNAPMPRLINDFRGNVPTTSGVSDWELLLTGVPY